MEQWSADDRKFAKELFFGWPGDFKPFVLGLINRARALRDAERESEFAALLTENARLRKLLQKVIKSFDDLVEHSDGVYGLHLNGDPAPWSELCEGGRFETWTLDFEDARAALGGENG